MNDPVPHQGESDGARLSALLTTDAPLDRRSESLGASSPASAPAQPAPLKAAGDSPVAPEKAQSPQPLIAHPPAPSVPAQTKRAVDVMVPAMPERKPYEAPITGNGWEVELERSAASTGVSANLMRKIAGRESGNNPNARASTSSATGLFQFIDGTWNSMRARYPQLALGSRLDANSQARAAPYYMREIQQNLHRALGRKPDDAESYLGWFLGPQGSARALRYAPETSVHEVVDAASIRANPGVFRKISTVGELYAWSARKMRQDAPREAYSVRETAAAKDARMGLTSDPASTARPVPFTVADDRKREQEYEDRAYSMVQAALAVGEQDWMVSNLLKNNGKAVYDPAFKVDQEMLGDDRVKALPPNYLPYLARSMSGQDFTWRLMQAERDHEVEQRLAATPYGLGIRLAVNMADPAGLALGIIAPVGMAVKGGRAAQFVATAADGAIGGLTAELPAIMHKPDYEAQQALWAGLTGTAGYLLFNRHLFRGTETELDQATQTMTTMRRELEAGTGLASGSVGAAQVAGYREPVRGDIEDWLKVETPDTAFAPFRFDFAKLKNSDNPVVAALADAMGLDTVGNANKAVAVTRPIEHERRMLETRATTLWSREYVSAAEDFRTRNGINPLDWKLAGEDIFQRQITGAVRNTDPMVKFDPAVQRMATAWEDLAGWWRERAINPGKDRGVTMRSLPFAEAWSDAKDYVPRFVAWDRWRELNATFGTQQMRSLIGRAIAAKNPDLDAEISMKLGGWYYDRIRSVEAGQELTGQRAFSSVDVEAMRKSLVEGLGLSEEEVGKVLFQATARDEAGKAITSRQKMRTHMDENFAMPLTGRDGVTRTVSVHELWEHNMRSIVHAYNSQMAGAVSLAQLRIENPRHIPDKVVDGELIPGTPKYLVDGIHSDGDWDKLMAQARAVDDQVRYADGRKTLEGEIRNLQWMKDVLTGVPHEFDRTRWGQLARIAQKLNFTRLMSQSGFAGIAELGQLTAQVGWRHALGSMTHLRDFKRDALTGKLGRDVLEDFEFTFGTATDHLRGSGMTMQSPSQATSLMDTGLNRRLERAEAALSLTSRATAMVSLTPVTVFSERVAERAVLSKFRAAALGDEKLNAQRMRIIGLDAEMQERVLGELKKHAGTVQQDGRPVQVLGLDKWDEQVRSAFEFAVSTWVRRIIQQNDFGQMNAVLGHPIARLLFQFRSFTLGAWSKQTLSSLHLRDWEALNGFWVSMVFGGAAYTAQTALNGIGLSGKDREEYVRLRLSDEKVALAAIQRAGQSSLLPGILDFGGGVFGFEPFFDTRSTGQATQGWGANPTTGLIDSVVKGAKGVSEAALHGEAFTGQDFRNLSRAVNVLHNFPLVLQSVNSTSSSLSN